VVDNKYESCSAGEPGRPVKNPPNPYPNIGFIQKKVGQSSTRASLPVKFEDRSKILRNPSSPIDRITITDSIKTHAMKVERARSPRINARNRKLAARPSIRPNRGPTAPVITIARRDPHTRINEARFLAASREPEKRASETIKESENTAAA